MYVALIQAVLCLHEPKNVLCLYESDTFSEVKYNNNLCDICQIGLYICSCRFITVIIKSLRSHQRCLILSFSAQPYTRTVYYRKLLLYLSKFDHSGKQTIIHFFHDVWLFWKHSQNAQISMS